MLAHLTLIQIVIDFNGFKVIKDKLQSHLGNSYVVGD